MPTDLIFYLIGLPAVFLVALGKGAFGGGLAILGVPLLALVVDPVNAAIMVAPLVCAMDLFALQAFPVRTWSWPDLAWLGPGMLAGLALGAVFFVYVDPPVLALVIALVTLWFTGRFFFGRSRSEKPKPVWPAGAVFLGALGGFTTFVAHAGGPPLAMYLLRRGLPKSVYAGTLVGLFTASNLIKVWPYLWFGLARPEALWQALALLPAVPLGVWAGKALHNRLDEQRLYFWCYLLLAAAGLKLLADGLAELLP
jgi:uncharacterized membrane protein YfcA